MLREGNIAASQASLRKIAQLIPSVKRTTLKDLFLLNFTKYSLKQDHTVLNNRGLRSYDGGGGLCDDRGEEA